MCAAVDQLLERDEMPSPSELDLLFDTHLIDQANGPVLDDMGAKLGDEVRGALEVVREAASSTSDFGASVHTVEAELDDLSDPAKVKNAVSSLMNVARQMGEHSTEMSMRLSSSVEEIEQLKSALDKATLESRTDSLTGVANRKCFDQTLINEIAEAVQTDKPLSLCMIDVDHFKKFNDAHGHRAGDSALRFVANMFQHSLRAYDLVARYGGEEFAVIMPNANLEIGDKVCSRMCESLSAREIVKRVTGERLGHITVSIGVAQLREGDTPESLIERADSALYLAKRSGRNQVQIESQNPDGHDQRDDRVA